ncbi:hypothetical protein GCM10017691_12600 [Pseudonocardia petroleophila]|uniref:ATP-binding protein n=1 Tax=Pseudonocardia petroleophila TaxID=37331 RepID=A0A7G7MIL0_9PSEU|nr:ATP-binding protein [Pseudonocardia petroleophila]QNG52621.1 ATP-binding protein [Pseudonocardia petroleophila]
MKQSDVGTRFTLESHGETEVFIEDVLDVTLGEFAALSDSVPARDNAAVHFDILFNRPNEHLSFFFLLFGVDGSIEIEFAVDKPIPYPLEDVHSLLDLAFMAVSGSVNYATLNSEGRGGDVWICRLFMNDLATTVRQVADSVVEARASLGIADNLRKMSSIAHVVNQLRGGRHLELIGQPESGWLEFKSFVDLDSGAAKIELAQDVSRFANSERAGLLVIGFRTDKRNGEDVAVKLSPLPLLSNCSKRYEDIIDSRIYPAVRGLSVEQIEVSPDVCIVVIYIPAQREDDKPFLVHGAIVEGKVEQTFFSIVRRRGEGSVPITAREVHALLSVGRRRLRP